MSRNKVNRLFLLWGLICALNFGSLAVGQEDPPPRPVEQPIVVFNLSSIENSLNEIGQMFSIAGRSDMMEVIENFLATDKVRNLQGVDRTRPIGVMVFLGTRLPPEPIPVAYFPVTSEPEFVANLRNAGADVIDQGEGSYALGTTKENSSALRFRDGYALISMKPGSLFLDEFNIANPADVTQRVSARYDLSLTLSLRSIPPLMKQVFATFFAQQSASQLQQRDFESDASYQARRAGGLSTLKWIEQLIRDGEEVVIGVDSTEDGRRAVLECSIDASESSEFAKCLTGIAGAPSYFSPLLREKHPLQISMSWNADPREKNAMLGFLEAFRLELQGRLPGGQHSVVNNAVESLQATVNAGHIDGIIQFIPTSERQLVFIAGFKVLGAETLNRQLQDLAHLLQENNSRFTVDLNTHEHNGTSFNRFRVEREKEPADRFFGGRPDLYWGVGENVLWIGVGGESILSTFDQAVESLSAPRTSATGVTAAPFNMIVRALPWMQVSERDDLGERQRRRRDLVESSMKPEDDAFRMEVRPSESGVRVTLRFDEGFVRLLGTAISDVYDRSQL